ncbi:MAG: hypothetical protein KIPDCIKN_04374 [Haliscomenobacter sp.]|nr:hypothetical protein [Haliscomenobacter sp.]
MTKTTRMIARDTGVAVLIAVVVTVILSMLGGCRTPLDDRQNELIDAWGAGNKAFAEVITQYQQATDKAAGRYHDLQQESIRREFTDWLDSHTDEFGGLVFVDADGNVKPMPAAKIVMEIERRDSAVAIVTESKSRWELVQASVRRASDDFVMMTNVSLSTNADIAEAKRSAQQFLDSALMAISTLATGAVVVGG